MPKVFDLPYDNIKDVPYIDPSIKLGTFRELIISEEYTENMLKKFEKEGKIVMRETVKM